MSAYLQLTSFFDKKDLKYQSDTNRQAVSAHFGGENGAYHLVAKVEDDGLLQVWARVPMNVPSGARPTIAEALCHANWGLKLGGFQMDWSDGEIVFHASSLLHDDMLSDDTINRVVFTALAALERYLPAFLSVIYANDEPAQAVSLVEQAKGSICEL